jgi:photosystem II stability/assembly factor-like uncharacterized protein
MKLAKIRIIHYLIFGFVLLAALLLPCQTAKEKSQSEMGKYPNGRNDKWDYVGAGGGGAMFYPTVSPHNPDVVFVSCDMGGSYVTYNGGESWRMFNLHDHVRFYVFDPLDSNTIYANSIGLFKSTDRGNTWSILYPAPSEIKGLVSKGDHAEEVFVTNDSTLRNVLALSVDPDNSKKLYMVVAINSSIALYVSKNGGKKWKKEKELGKEVQKIFIDPSSSIDDRTIYIAGKSGITQKLNGIWKFNKAPIDVIRLNEFSGGYDEKNKKFIIYAISGKSYFNPEKEKSGIYFTDDGGLTWENRQNGIIQYGIKDADFPEWRTIATSSLHPEVVYVSYNGLKVTKGTTCIGVAKSEDYGRTWKLVWKDNITNRGNTASLNFSKDWLNERFGPTWGENPFSIGVAPTNPDICYATDFGRTIKTSTGGNKWEQVYSININNSGWKSNGLEVTTGYNVVFDPFDMNHVFITNTDIGLMESKDGAESWTSATKNNGVPHSWANNAYWLTFDRDVKGKAWAAMSGTHDLPRPKMFRKNGTAGYKGGILQTENGGKTWKPISIDIGEAAMTHILIDPISNKTARILYACAFGKGVYKSIDGGKSWKLNNNGIEGAEPFAWRIVRRENDGVLFLIVSRRSEDGSIGNEKDGALYKSVDGAENWTKVPLPSEANGPTSLVFDNKDPNKIILSTWGRITQGKFTPEIGGGIYITNDEGKTWTQVLKKDQHIHDITIDIRNNRLYACGFNGSAYYSEDGGNKWIRIKGYNFKWGKRVEPDPRDPEKIFIITFGGGVWFGAAKGDDKALEDIVPPLKYEKKVVNRDYLK